MILKNYSPKLIVAEFNPTLEQGKALTVPDEQDFKWEGDNYFGFSFEAGKRLGAEFGYTIVHQENNMNMFLVSNEFLNGVDVPEVIYEQSEMFKKSGNTNWTEV